MWFADDLESMEKAIAICNQCSLQEKCLEYGIEHMVQGIWGGTVESVRKAIRRQRGIVGIQVKLTDFK
jgi:WhiB family redox-sensing transcriptional regulator